MLPVVALSLLSAFLFAASATIQQHATRDAADAQRQAHALTASGQVRQSERQRVIRGLLPVLTLIRQLARSGLWLLGWCTNLLGFVIQAAALHLGSVALVQPVLVTQLLFTLPMMSLWGRRTLLVRDWVAAGSICAGVGLFLSTRGAPADAGSADRSAVLLAVAAVAAAVVVILLGAVGRSPSVHGGSIAVAAGLCFALSAVLTKLTTADLIHRGVPATAVDWPGYLLAASTLLGLLLGQEAYRSGPLAIAVAAMSITNPIVSYLIGILAFNISLPTGAGDLAAIAGSAALLVVGVLTLAGSPTVAREASAADMPVRTARLNPKMSS